MFNPNAQSGHAALRKGRHSRPYQHYFITVCCTQRNALMASDGAAKAAAMTLHKLHADGHLNLLAWVVMPDHLHVLLQLDESKSLAVAVGRMHSCIAKAVNKSLGRVGTFWQQAYYESAVRHEGDTTRVIRYIVNNPIKAGLAETPGNYPYWNITGWNGVSFW
jgi:REP element-mobilizing transposase RayT